MLWSLCLHFKCMHVTWTVSFRHFKLSKSQSNRCFRFQTSHYMKVVDLSNCHESDTLIWLPFKVRHQCITCILQSLPLVGQFMFVLFSQWLITCYLITHECMIACLCSVCTHLFNGGWLIVYSSLFCFDSGLLQTTELHITVG